MNTTSPQEAKIALPKLIEIRCPFCRALGRRAVIGKLLWDRQLELVQQAAAGEGYALAIEPIYYCRDCNVNFVFGVIVV